MADKLTEKSIYTDLKIEVDGKHYKGTAINLVYKSRSLKKASSE